MIKKTVAVLLLANKVIISKSNRIMKDNPTNFLFLDVKIILHIKGIVIAA